MEKWLTIPEALEYLEQHNIKITYRTALRKIRRGEIYGEQFSRAMQIPLSELQRFVNRGTKRPAATTKRGSK